MSNQFNFHYTLLSLYTLGEIHQLQAIAHMCNDLESNLGENQFFDMSVIMTKIPITMMPEIHGAVVGRVDEIAQQVYEADLRENHCGTVGCALGWAIDKGIIRQESIFHMGLFLRHTVDDQDFRKKTLRYYVSHVCFSSAWADIAPTPNAVKERIQYLLTNGIPRSNFMYIYRRLLVEKYSGVIQDYMDTFFTYMSKHETHAEPLDLAHFIETGEEQIFKRLERNAVASEDLRDTVD